MVAMASAKATIQIAVLATTGEKNTRDRHEPKRSVIGPNANPRSSVLRILDLVIPPSKGKEYPLILKHSETVYAAVNKAITVNITG
ncbi:MAG: hypothetical protein HW390_3192 [Candidatus Brocadiaceae bacterium]|nr:hypothetical protein [Candidatus Brocadiaceae bacterium]